MCTRTVIHFFVLFLNDLREIVKITKQRKKLREKKSKLLQNLMSHFTTFNSVIFRIPPVLRYKITLINISHLKKTKLAASNYA